VLQITLLLHAFLFFFVMVGIEPRGSHMLSKCSITKLHSQPRTLNFNII
jgi:hypothetical protein